MSTLDEWIADTCRALELPADALPADLRTQLLDLTKDVAHGVTRIAGPLTTFLVGLAVGRGVAPSSAVDAVAALMQSRQEAQGPDPDGGSAGSAP